MIRKICPICDQTMKSAHYCRNCRTWVSAPIVRDVDYYLNERHPSWETDCSYHTMPEQAAQSGKSGWNPKPQTVSSKRPKSSERSSYPPVPGPVRRPTSEKVVGRAVSSTIVIVVMAVLVTLFQLPGQKTPESYDADLDAYMDLADQAEDYLELTDEEVREAGVVCNSTDHLPVSGEALVQELVRLLERQGLEICGTNTYSFNEVYDDGTTWYDTWTSIDLRDGEMGTYQYVEVDYDTATGDLHQVSLSLEDGTVLVNTAAEVLAFIGEHGGPAGLAQYGDQLREELMAAMQQEAGYQLECEGVYLEGVSYDTNYNVVVVPMNQ